MPGNIRVSVREAIDLPAEVAASKYVSVKVSVGKREFQTKPSMATDGKTAPWNSDFSFPVLNFQDHLVVMLLDSKGDQVAKNEIQTPFIVERGFQDEFLALKGGGQIHLKLNFVLTDEEKQKIDLMRAAVSKRKQKDVQKIGSNQAVQTAAGNEKNSSYMSITAVAGIGSEEKIKIQGKNTQQVVVDAVKEMRKEISLGLESLKEPHVSSCPDQAQEVVISDIPLELHHTTLSFPKPLLVTPASNLSSGLAVTVSPFVHPISPEAISFLQLPMLQPSGTSQTAPNNVKAKIKVFETSFSQNDHVSTPSSRGQSNKLHARWSGEKLGAVARNIFEEERTLINAEEKQIEAVEVLKRPDKKRLAAEEEMRNSDLSIAEKQIEQQSNRLKLVEYDKRKNSKESSLDLTPVFSKEKRDAEEKKFFCFKSEEVLSSAEVGEGAAGAIDASGLGQSNFKNMSNHVIPETYFQGSAIVDKTISPINDNNRSHGSQSSTHLVKKILGAAVIAAGGAFLMWARAGNIKQRHHTKKGEQFQVLSRRAK